MSRRTAPQSWCTRSVVVHDCLLHNASWRWAQDRAPSAGRPRAQPYGGCAARPETAAPLFRPRDALSTHHRRLGLGRHCPADERGRAPHTHASQRAVGSHTRARAASGDGRGIFLARRQGQNRPTQRTPRHAGQGRLVPRRGRAPAARHRGPRHAQVVGPRGAPAGPHGQAVPGAVAQPAEPRHQQAALDGRRGQGHIEELRAVRRALGRHRPGPARAHGQRRQEPLEL